MLKTILKYVRWISGAIIALGVLIFIAYQLWGKSKKKDQIEQRIQELTANTQKTEADTKELERLNVESDQIQADIASITQVYTEKLKDLEKPKDPPKPGDAGKAADEFGKVW